MKELWIDLDTSIPNHVKNRLLPLAVQVCDVIVVDGQNVENVWKTRVKIAAASGNCDIQVLNNINESKITKTKSVDKPIAFRISIKGKEDEEKAAKAADLQFDYIIVDCSDWKIIPLENLIAKTRGKSRLLAEVSDAEEAKIAVETLQLGVDGVVLKTSDINELMKTAAAVKKQKLKIELSPLKIVKIKQIGTGARACVDTCDLMKAGEGLLVGCQSAGFFLIEAEVYENPYVEPRPFRVNAGSISLYTLSTLSNTRYLSELKAGDQVLITDRQGNIRLANVGRVKIEFRPLILIEAEIDEKKVKTILQNAETIRLVTLQGSKSITGLKVGDEVLGYVTEGGGRHFGILVNEETVMER